MTEEGFLLKLLRTLAPAAGGQKPVLNKKLIAENLKSEIPNLPHNALTPQLFELLENLGLIEKSDAYNEKNKVYIITSTGEDLYELLQDRVQLSDIINHYMSYHGKKVLEKEDIKE